MLRIVPQDTHIKFLRLRTASFIFSGLLILAAGFLYFTRDLNYGIDFEGGMLLQIRAESDLSLSDLRNDLGNLGLGDLTIQGLDHANQAMIRFEIQGSEDENDAAKALVKAEIEKTYPGVIYDLDEKVGSVVGDELKDTAKWAVFFSVLAVLIYIWFRFEWHFGVGAVVALIHDVTLTIGFFSITQLEFNLSIIAAILTIVGYSLNDTVVVFDRIRENLRKFRKMPLEELLDLSINQTLGRTLMTSLTTLVALGALFFFGGEVIRGFTAAMIWGIFVGTYSSIFIAAPVLVLLKLKRTDVTAEEAGV